MKTLALFAILLSVFVMSCSSEPGSVEPRLQGTENAGGGNVEGSTSEDVKESVLKMQKLIASPKHIEDMFGHFSEATERFDYFGEKIHARALKVFVDLSKVKSTSLMGVFSTDAEAKKIENQCLNPLDFVTQVKINFSESGCKLANHKTADAGVEDYNFSSTVCFDLRRFRQLPKADLDKSIYGIWWHEVFHLAGERDEILAEFVERWSTFSYLNYAKADRELFLTGALSKLVNLSFTNSRITSDVGSSLMFLSQSEAPMIENTVLGKNELANSLSAVAVQLRNESLELLALKHHSNSYQDYAFKFYEQYRFAAEFAAQTSLYMDLEMLKTYDAEKFGEREFTYPVRDLRSYEKLDYAEPAFQSDYPESSTVAKMLQLESTDPVAYMTVIYERLKYLKSFIKRMNSGIRELMKPKALHFFRRNKAKHHLEKLEFVGSGPRARSTVFSVFLKSEAERYSSLKSEDFYLTKKELLKAYPDPEPHGVTGLLKFYDNLYVKSILQIETANEAAQISSECLEKVKAKWIGPQY